MIGKLDPETLRTVLDRTGASNPALLTGAAYGEDAAAIDLGDGETLVVSSDPISLAAEAAGTLGVHVACNDIAAAGADPEFLTNVIFLPDDDPDTIATLTSQLDTAATEIGVTIVGGHTEYVPTLSRPLLSLTAFGRTDRHIPTGGAEPGDKILLTKGAAIEATGIIATDFVDKLRDEGVDEAVIDRAATYFDEISVLEDSRALRDVATAMHDPTEGGVITGLVELATAANVDMVVDREAVPIRPETEAVCTAMGVDPLRIFGSGALLATVPADGVDAAETRLGEAGIASAVIGTVESSAATDVSAALVLDGERITEASDDQLYPFWE
ncbi:hydrogenase expression/formation protein HypE [Halohasta litchfieldiae]|jgi:hydrogenase expression/formation protein HypE|uniref:Hydrogenase expression/formation protein HypE n=1 Tax=Halohasta litchfieldiae TaxID=1073996 RepID=A0A1H6UPB0_9EURY|nr:AIR synthase family protein [Halohasta litchfieldiae]ATW89446.1 hydrogenase expression/formation protein HypE [Halohasta litchfieldiae]SEI92534.1 hydrogenase expression/formation protein HypE [Halohasta litchfieldiae]